MARGLVARRGFRGGAALGVLSMLAAAATAWPTSACGLCSCTSYGCRRLTVDPHTPDPSTASVTIDGQSIPLTVGGDTYGVPPAGRCSATLKAPIVEDPGSVPAEKGTSPHWSLVVVCNVHDGGFYATIDSRDLRLLGAGTYPVAADTRADAFVDHYGWCVDGYASSVTLTVEDATGGFAPWPTVVTPDFARRLRYDGKLAGSNSFGLCDAGNEKHDVAFSIELTLGAADFHADDHATCTQCAC